MIFITDSRYKIPHTIPMISSNCQIIASKFDGMINGNLVLSFSRNDIGYRGKISI